MEPNHVLTVGKILILDFSKLGLGSGKKKTRIIRPAGEQRWKATMRLHMEPNHVMTVGMICETVQMIKEGWQGPRSYNLWITLSNA